MLRVRAPPLCKLSITQRLDSPTCMSPYRDLPSVWGCCNEKAFLDLDSGFSHWSWPLISTGHMQGIT
jgi:hypothetical protein